MKKLKQELKKTLRDSSLKVIQILNCVKFLNIFFKNILKDGDQMHYLIKKIKEKLREMKQKQIEAAEKSYNMTVTERFKSVLF